MHCTWIHHLYIQCNYWDLGNMYNNLLLFKKMVNTMQWKIKSGNFGQILCLYPILSVGIIHWTWWSATLWFPHPLSPTIFKRVPVVWTSTLHWDWFRWSMAVIHWQRWIPPPSLEHLVAGRQCKAVQAVAWEPFRQHSPLLTLSLSLSPSPFLAT